MAKNIRRELDRLRLPELQQRFRDVIGEETRCPNRTFLIRRITIRGGDVADSRVDREIGVPDVPEPREDAAGLVPKIPPV